MIDDDNYELASAYSDGELSAAERAVVEQDPELLAVASQITEMRNVLATTTPDSLPKSLRADPAMKARQLSVAGAAFDELNLTAPVQGASTSHAASSSASTAQTSNVIDLRSKKRYRALTMAAGFIVVAGVGVMGLTSLRSDSTTDSATSSAELADGAFDTADERLSDGADEAANTEAAEAPMAQDDAALASSVAETETTAAAEAESLDTDVVEDASEEAAGEDDEKADSGPAEPTHFFGPEATLAEMLDTVIAEGTEPIESSCATDLFPPTFISSAYVVQRNLEVLEILVGVEPEVTSVLLVDRECQALDQLERPTE